MLIKRGANVNAVDENNDSALLLAVSHGNFQCFKYNFIFLLSASEQNINNFDKNSNLKMPI